MRPAALFVLVLALALGAPGCDSRQDEVDLETQQWQYLLLTLPTDVQGRCEAAVGPALSCAASAGSIPVKLGGTTLPLAASGFYIGFHETAYGVTVEAPRGAAQLCNALVASPNYPAPGLTNTNGARVCYHDCEKELWERMSNAGLCTATGFQSLTKETGSASAQLTILALSKDGPYTVCVETCLRRGTLLPQ